MQAISHDPLVGKSSERNKRKRKDNIGKSHIIPRENIAYSTKRINVNSVYGESRIIYMGIYHLPRKFQK